MQFNYLGGQSTRDTLSQALGQRNPVLEGQLEFTKNAFTTGVSSAGQTMRQAMGDSQRQRESLLTSKTTKEEGVINRQSNKDLLSERLAGEKEEFDRRFEIEGRRQEGQTLEEIRRENLRTDAEKEEYKRRTDLEREEFNRRQGIVDQKTKDETAKLGRTQKGKLQGYQTKFDAALGAVSDPAVREKMQGNWNKVIAALEATTDPDERAGLMETLSGLLDPNTQKNLAEAKPLDPASGTPESTEGKRDFATPSPTPPSRTSALKPSGTASPAIPQRNAQGILVNPNGGSTPAYTPPVAKAQPRTMGELFKAPKAPAPLSIPDFGNPNNFWDGKSDLR